MHKAECDNVMTRLSQADRDQFRYLMHDVRTRAAASRPGDMVRQRLASHGHTMFPALLAALEAVVARDAMGPQVGTYPLDFSLKRLSAEEWVHLASFQGQRPVALVFGSYT